MAINPIINTLIHARPQDVKKLSQDDRRFCLKELDLFLKSESTISEALTGRVVEIEKTLYSKPEKVNCLIKLITSLFKAILNLFGRISSNNIYGKIEQAKNRILNDHFDDYILTNCHVRQGFTADTKVFFLGDNHADPVQKRVRMILMEKLALPVRQDNLHLYEGLHNYEKIPGFRTQTWEIEEHYNAPYNDQMNALLHQLKLVRDQIPNVSQLEKLKLLVEAQEINARMGQLQVHIDENMKLRDQDLRTATLNSNAKRTFSVAGENHLKSIEQDFPEACILIPKTSQIGLIKAEQVLTNFQNGVQYDAAYRDI